MAPLEAHAMAPAETMERMATREVNFMLSAVDVSRRLFALKAGDLLLCRADDGKAGRSSSRDAPLIFYPAAISGESHSAEGSDTQCSQNLATDPVLASPNQD